MNVCDFIAGTLPGEAFCFSDGMTISMPIAPPVSNCIAKLDRVFRATPIERGFTPVAGIEGHIPPFLRGTLYLNGPAQFHADTSTPYRHWLDGDGMVCALNFSERGVFYARRFVQGQKWLREQQLGRPLYRTFGTAFQGDRLKRGMGMECPFNVNVLRYHGRLLAFGEQSLPMELDPATLDTKTPGRVFDFDGALNDAAPFSAHPKFDPQTGELMNFGVFWGERSPLLIYYRFDADGALAVRTRVPLDYPCSVHDFAVSDRFAVFFLSPYVLDIDGVIHRGRTTMECMSWQPECGSRLLVLCRETGRVCTKIALDARYCLHTVNAFEDHGRLSVDVIEFDQPFYDQYQPLPYIFQDVSAGRPVRYVVDTAAGRVCLSQDINCESACDFPAIDPSFRLRAYDDFWMQAISATHAFGPKSFDQLLHRRWNSPDDLDDWQAPSDHFFGGEPIFIGDPNGSGAGRILCHLIDTAALKSCFAIFDAYDVAAGPQAVINLAEALHFGFHGCFEPRNDCNPSQ